MLSRQLQEGNIMYVDGYFFEPRSEGTTSHQHFLKLYGCREIRFLLSHDV